MALSLKYNVSTVPSNYSVVGKYVIFLGLWGTCSAYEFPITLNFGMPTSTNNITYENTLISIFPNPAGDVININSSSANYQLFIYDTMGTLIQRINDLSFDAQINITLFNPAIYYFHLLNNKNGYSLCEKMIIEQISWWDDALS